MRRRAATRGGGHRPGSPYIKSAGGTRFRLTRNRDRRSVTTVTQQPGQPKLRRCKARDCREWFLPRPRGEGGKPQQYCGEQCAGRDRKRRLRAREREQEEPALL